MSRCMTDSKRCRTSLCDRLSPVEDRGNRSVSFKCSQCSRYLRSSSCSPPCYRRPSPPYRSKDITCSPCSTCPDKVSSRSHTMARDKFSSMCYPCKIPTARPYISYHLDKSPRESRRKSKCYSTSCPKSCSPCYDPGVTCKIRGDRCPPRCSDCLFKPRPPCCDTDSPKPSTDFMLATREAGTCPSRFTPHMCPWEADVAVSGTVRAHCSSTADEVSSRLSGRFKANGKRFTTDSCFNRSPCIDNCSQRLSLGRLENGCGLNFSRNSLRYSDDIGLNERIKRIIDPPIASSSDHRSRDSSLKQIFKNSDRDEDAPKWAATRTIGEACESRAETNNNDYDVEKVKTSGKIYDVSKRDNRISETSTSCYNDKKSALYRKSCLKRSDTHFCDMCNRSRNASGDRKSNYERVSSCRQCSRDLEDDDCVSKTHDMPSFSISNPRSSKTKRSWSPDHDSANNESLNLDNIHFRPEQSSTLRDGRKNRK